MTEDWPSGDYEDILREDGVVWRVCWNCGGEGVDGHYCGEDTCVCLEPRENVRCRVCGGLGGWILFRRTWAR